MENLMKKTDPRTHETAPPAFILLAVAAVLAAVALTPDYANAITLPAPGDLWYGIYDGYSKIRTSGAIKVVLIFAAMGDLYMAKSHPVGALVAFIITVGCYFADSLVCNSITGIIVP